MEMMHPRLSRAYDRLHELEALRSVTCREVNAAMTAYTRSRSAVRATAYLAARDADDAALKACATQRKVISRISRELATEARILARMQREAASPVLI